jgi:hypothetical protein
MLNISANMLRNPWQYGPRPNFRGSLPVLRMEQTGELFGPGHPTVSKNSYNIRMPSPFTRGVLTPGQSRLTDRVCWLVKSDVENGNSECMAWVDVIWGRIIRYKDLSQSTCFRIIIPKYFSFKIFLHFIHFDRHPFKSRWLSLQSTSVLCLLKAPAAPVDLGLKPQQTDTSSACAARPKRKAKLLKKETEIKCHR